MSPLDAGAPPGRTRRVAMSGIAVGVGTGGAGDLGRAAAERLGIPLSSVRGWRVIRRSLDARGRGRPRFVYRLGLEIDTDTPLPDLPCLGAWTGEAAPLVRPQTLPPTRPLIIGSGPAGLFAALRLAAYGLRPLVLERGAPVEERVRDVAGYWRRGILNPESNVQFGEGGAGAFSDGKLTCRGKDPRTPWVFEQLVGAGAPEEILYEARPHLGTDRLRGILRAIRSLLEAAGCEIRFHTRVDGVIHRGGRVEGVSTRHGRTAGFPVFLAPGHSARDFITALVAQGVPAAPKGFALGLRVEVPQAAVDQCQYGRWAGEPELPAAEFSVKARAPGGRDVYSFCMCPGGTVIPAGSEPGGLVINGMSGSRRSRRWANAALVAAVSPEDFGADGLSGIRLQQEWERAAFWLGGGTGVPAQRALDFVSDRASKTVPRSSCPWEPVAADLGQCLPGFVTEALRGGLPMLFRQLPPLEAGLLLGVEARTSSPIRLLRGDDLESPGFCGLYPIGEGAGYAGGIVSSAVDGARAADAYVRAHAEQEARSRR